MNRKKADSIFAIIGNDSRSSNSGSSSGGRTE